MLQPSQQLRPLKLRQSTTDQQLRPQRPSMSSYNNETSADNISTRMVTVQPNNKSNTNQQLRKLSAPADNIQNTQQQQQRKSSQPTLHTNDMKPSAKLSMTQRAAVASRVFRSNAIPPGLLQRLQREPWFWADELLANKHINDVWLHYDSDCDGVLNKRECTVLAQNAVDRLLHKYKECVMRDRNIDAQAAMKVTLHDSVNFLPCNNIDDSKLKICDRLLKELDIGRDGVVTKSEFLFQWPRSCKKLLTIEQPKSMGCTVM